MKNVRHQQLIDNRSALARSGAWRTQAMLHRDMKRSLLSISGRRASWFNISNSLLAKSSWAASEKHRIRRRHGRRNGRRHRHLYVKYRQRSEKPKLISADMKYRTNLAVTGKRFHQDIMHRASRSAGFISASGHIKNSKQAGAEQRSGQNLIIWHQARRHHNVAAAKSIAHIKAWLRCSIKYLYRQQLSQHLDMDGRN